MTRTSRIIAHMLTASLLMAQAVPVRADSTRDFIIQQQKDECRRLGGRYEYPKCYLPETSPKTKPDDDAWCDWGCQIILGILGAAAARAAYCKANPAKC